MRAPCGMELAVDDHAQRLPRRLHLANGELRVVGTHGADSRQQSASARASGGRRGEPPHQ